MKKLFAVLAALLLIACMPLAVAQTALPEDFQGNWELSTVSLDGYEFTAAEVGLPGVVNVHEDDTVSFALKDRFCVSPATFSDGSCTFQAPMMAVALTMNAEGCLVTNVELDGIDVQLVFRRAAASEPSQGFTPYLGGWKAVKITLDGADVTSVFSDGCSLDIYADGYALLQLSDDGIGSKVTEADGKFTMSDDAGGVYPMTINAQGQLIVEIADDSNDIVLTLEKEGEPAAEKDTSLTAIFGKLTQQVQRPVDMEGVWVCTRTVINGKEYSAASRGMEITLTLQEGVDTLNFGGNLIEREAAVTENSVNIGGVCFQLNDQGELFYTMSEGGSTISVYLEKQDVSVQKPVGLEGVWVCTRATMNGTEYSAGMLGMDVTLTVQDGVDTLHFGDDVIEKEAEVTDDSVNISGISFQLNAQGELVYALSEDGATIHLYLERQGN